MRRFLSLAAIAILAVAVATPANAGYLIVRVILEGSSADPGITDGGPGVGPQPPGPMSGPPKGPRGSGFGPPGGVQPGGGPGSAMRPGTPGATAPGTQVSHDPTRSLVVVIPIEEDVSIQSPFYKKYAPNQTTNPNWRPKLHTTLRGEKFITNLFTDSSTIQWYETLLQTPAPKKTRVNDVRELHAKWLKLKTEPRLLLAALNAALASGFIEDAGRYADELLAFATETKESLPPDVAGFAAAYGKMQPGMKAAATRPSRAEYWQSKLDPQNAVVTQSHYALIYWDATPGEVKRRLDVLEENFKGFYLWHATRGIALPIPDAPLLAILLKRGSDVFPLARALDAPTRLSADGFYSPEHELLVLSPERLDDVGLTFVRQAQQMYQEGISRDQLLMGEGPKLDVNGEMKDRKKPDDVARMQTIALVERLVEDTALVATVSHEGSRQLLYASQQLPRYVTLPEWVNQGAASFFTRPRDPAFITTAEGKTVMTVATATGYGAPNYVLHRYFKDLLEKKELNPDHAALLKNVLSDAYFHGLRDAKEARDPDPARAEKTGIAINSGGPAPTNPGNTGGPPGLRPPTGGIGGPLGPPMGPPGSFPPGAPGAMTGAPTQEDPIVVLRKKRERLGIKAQATAWALYYYLEKARPVELRRFLDEMGAMPRDLPLDSQTIMAAFYRAFNLDGTKATLDPFAKAWLDYLRDVAQLGIDVPLVEPKHSAPAAPMGGGPPGFPGGPQSK